MCGNLIQRLKQNECGQALVEFALVLPILLALLCGIVDFGWLYYNQIALNNAAREGARYAVVHYDPSQPWREEAQARMIDVMVGVNSATAVVSDPMGQQITATATSNTPILTGFTSTIIGRRSMALHASCTMRLED